MATSIVTRDGQVVATRFFGGTSVGCVVQMEVNETEWAMWRTVEVAEECSDRWQTFQSWVEDQTATIRWDSAARQNEMARDFENHRWVDEIECISIQAAKCRQRARVMVRDAMKVMS